jgi:hypothetical protein
VWAPAVSKTPETSVFYGPCQLFKYRCSLTALLTLLLPSHISCSWCEWQICWIYSISILKTSGSNFHGTSTILHIYIHIYIFFCKSNQLPIILENYYLSLTVKSNYSVKFTYELILANHTKNRYSHFSCSGEKIFVSLSHTTSISDTIILLTWAHKICLTFLNCRKETKEELNI